MGLRNWRGKAMRYQVKLSITLVIVAQALASCATAPPCAEPLACAAEKAQRERSMDQMRDEASKDWVRNATRQL